MIKFNFSGLSGKYTTYKNTSRLDTATYYLGSICTPKPTFEAGYVLCTFQSVTNGNIAHEEAICSIIYTRDRSAWIRKYHSMCWRCNCRTLLHRVVSPDHVPSALHERCRDPAIWYPLSQEKEAREPNKKPHEREVMAPCIGA